MQTEVIRSAVGASRRSQAVTGSLSASAPAPPGTTSVCGAAAAARPPSGTRVSPLDVRTGAPSGLATVIRYAGPSAPRAAR